MKKKCPGCGSSLVRRVEAGAADEGMGYVQWCNNPQCPLRSKCEVCRNPLEPITEPVPCARARCMTETCRKFGRETDDNWPDRYAA